MNDKPISETPPNEINYGEVIVGKPPEPKIVYEIFISHCTKTETEKDIQQRNFVEAIVELIETKHNLPVFYDNKDIHSNPATIVSNSLESSRILVPICTPEYIKKFKDNRSSWINGELTSFLEWSNNKSKDLIIPVLLDISRRDFSTQGVGIALITGKKNVEVPSDYATDKTIVDTKAAEIVLIYKDYLKQWTPSSS